MELDRDICFRWQNVVMITLDSCRYDTFVRAEMPVLKSQCTFKKAFAQGTFTYPSHLAMYSGFFPSICEMIAYYNRLEKYLLFIRGGNKIVDSFLEFPVGTTSIVNGFRRLGYRTFGLGAMEWFRHPNLASEFDRFHMTGIHMRRQIDLFLQEAADAQTAPIFALLNIGETHDPYRHGGQIDVSSRVSTELRRSPSSALSLELFERQVDCCEFIDRGIAPVIDWAAEQSRDTVFVVCADHGECFGEDGLYGHGFFHEMVITVPMGIFLARGLVP